MVEPAYTIILRDPAAPCPCGSASQGGNCCLDTAGRAKLPPPPLTVVLRADAVANYRNPECYARLLGGCSAETSGEHFLSEAVLRVFTADGKGKLTASRFPFLPAGAERVVGPATLKAPVLCKVHNSALSRYDELAKRFCSALIHIADDRRTFPPENLLFNGDDFEGWLLKTLCGTHAMERLVARKEHWTAPIEWLRRLFKIDGAAADPQFWVNVGEPVPMAASGVDFSITPVDAEDCGDPYGLDLRICGMKLVLMITRKGKSRVAPDGFLRPGAITIRNPAKKSENTIALRWRYGPVGVRLYANMGRV